MRYEIDSYVVALNSHDINKTLKSVVKKIYIPSEA
jgi:hypothetical protein